MKILVTCPPMLALRQEIEPLLSSKGIDSIWPEVVQTLDEDQLIQTIQGCDGWIIGDDPATRRVVRAGKKAGLRAAVKWGVGVDNIDFKAFEEAGIPIRNTPHMFGSEVADIAMGYIIGLARHTFLVDRAVRSGRWLKPQGISLDGKTAGVVGFGDVGRNLAKRLLASGVNVQAYDPALGITGMADVDLYPWPGNIEDCDFLVLCCSLNPSTEKMVNRALLERCKPGVLLVNVSRGGLIDERELILALESGAVGGAALDVFEVEPFEPNSPFLFF